MHTVVQLQQHRRRARAVSTAKLPREMLRSLIDRSGLSQSSVANKMGFASPSGLNRYIRETTQGDDPIPVDIVKRLVPIIRGLGHPPITSEEIMALTTLPLSNGMARDHASDTGSLPIRYRIEEGTYHKLADARAIGRSPISPAADWPASAQFVAVVAKEFLHCVDKTQFSPVALMGRRALLSVRYGQSDLYEIKIGRIGEKMAGQVLGVIVGTYTRE